MVYPVNTFLDTQVKRTLQIKFKDFQGPVRDLEFAEAEKMLSGVVWCNV